MALTATVYPLEITLSDVDRATYESFELRVARHPSESLRYMLTRILAYCLEHREGITFSKGGLSSTEEPPVLVRDATGALTAWIEIGAPSAERLHKASKASPHVALYTHTDIGLLRREAATRKVHRLEDIAVWRFEPEFLDSIAERLERRATIEVMRNDGQLYVTLGGDTHSTECRAESLA